MVDRNLNMNRSRLLRVARGDEPAELLLQNCRVVNVHSGEVHDADVAIVDGQFCGFGNYEARQVIDLDGEYLAPGLIDAHVHLESSMVSIPEFAATVLPHATTAVVTDPHEIANVMGMEGIRFILEQSEGLPLQVFVMLPSCVPATTMETSGARLDAVDLAPLLDHPRVMGLAEVMNYPGVINDDPTVMAKLEMALGRPKDGHAPLLTGKGLNAYIGAGITSDHECTRLEEAREKLRLGMHLLLREGTTERNLLDLLPLVTPQNASRLSFCTDDCHPQDLLTNGHIDHLLRMAIGKGFDPIIAIQMATINTARHYRLPGVGMIGPGYRADCFTFKDLQDIRPGLVFSKGRLVAKDGILLEHISSGVQADGRPCNIDWAEVDFTIPAREASRARVMEVIPGQIVTNCSWHEVRVVDGLLQSDTERDILKIAVIERHHGSGRMAMGLVRGFGMVSGAIASTVAHDSHNLVVVGVDDSAMMAAARLVAAQGGGQAVVAGERVAILPLPIAGLISNLPLPQVQERLKGMVDIYNSLGGRLYDPFMTISFLALPVIPEIRLTDQGLVDVTKFAMTSLFE